jgi:hypothetical protein
MREEQYLYICLNEVVDVFIFLFVTGGYQMA